AEPQPRLHNQAVDARVGEPPPRRDSSRPAANDRHFGIVDGHTPFRDGRIQKPAPILTMRGGSALISSISPPSISRSARQPLPRASPCRRPSFRGNRIGHRYHHFAISSGVGSINSPFA